MAGREFDGIFGNMVLRQGQSERPPVLRRSNSTSSRATPQLGVPGRVGPTSSTGAGSEEQQQQQQQPQQQLQPRNNRRSLSAERSHWVAAPVTKPKAERWVPLPFPHYAPLEEDEEIPSDALSLLAREASDTWSPTAGSYQAPGVRGRILIITACESFEREEVEQTLRMALPHCVLTKYPEVIHMEAGAELDGAGRRSSVTEGGEPGEVFIFDYGVVICWGLEEEAEQHVLKLLRPCQIKALPPDEVHQEALAFHYTADQPPHIQNDCITISRREARDVLVKMAISHGLAQSSKLTLYESRVGTLVEQVRHLPESLAKHGEIRMSRINMAKIKGQVFIQKSEVNLLSTVLDTPDFFWSAPDALRNLYNKVCEYNELSGRIELVNSRTMLIQSMLRIWSDHKAHHYLVRLDRIVIILVMLEVIIAAAEVVGFFLHKH